MCLYLCDGTHYEKNSQFIVDINPNSIINIVMKSIYLLKTLATFFLMLNIPALHAQQLEINTVKVENDGFIHISGHFSQKHSQREAYDFFVYTSVDNYKTPLDIPQSTFTIQQDNRFSVRFDGGQVLQGIQGEIKFKIEARASKFPVEIIPLKKNTVARGNALEIGWNDYHDHEDYQLILKDMEDYSDTISQNVAEERYQWYSQKAMKPGKYQLIVLPQGNTELASEPVEVKIKRRLPWGIKVIGFIGLGIAYYLIQDNETETPVETGVADPPPPPMSN